MHSTQCSLTIIAPHKLIAARLPLPACCSAKGPIRKVGGEGDDVLRSRFQRDCPLFARLREVEVLGSRQVRDCRPIEGGGGGSGRGEGGGGGGGAVRSLLYGDAGAKALRADMHACQQRSSLGNSPTLSPTFGSIAIAIPCRILYAGQVLSVLNVARRLRKKALVWKRPVRASCRDCYLTGPERG
jgi:hypothetical protein